MHRKFNYVYLLISLALVLPIATASLERAFSAMKDGDVCNKMGDQWLRDGLVIYIEKDVFGCIDNEAIMLHFHNMKTRVKQL